MPPPPDPARRRLRAARARLAIPLTALVALGAGILLACDNNHPVTSGAELCTGGDIDADGWSDDCDNCPGTFRG